MFQKPGNKSLDWLMASARPPGQPRTDPLVAWMKRESIPVTREAYLSLAHPEGVPEPYPAELELELPDEVRNL